jgi:predicted  nucleic acid-binding Zn-ribbon protein
MWAVAMTSIDTRADVVPYAPKKKNGHSEVDQLDRAGNTILGLVNRAANTTEADLQEAREAAEKLADQLRAARDQIKKLEANVRYHHDRADRAEKWLHHISSEVEQRFFRADESRLARRLARS